MAKARKRAKPSAARSKASLSKTSTTKKRSQADSTASLETRPLKRRKAAEAGRAKVRKLAEEAISDEEGILDEKVEDAAGAEPEDGNSDTEDLENHHIEAPTVVAPGFRLWQTTSQLASRGKLSQLYKYDEEKEEFSHVLKIKKDEAFTVVPLTVTQGPYKGRRVFMLEPTTGFRFMAFPPEIRNLVYSFLMQYDAPVKMSTSKKVNEPRRPVMLSRVWNISTKDWKEQPTTQLTVLRSSKQLLREAATFIYGNHFEFRGLGELKIFLDRIGSMRSYLRHIHIGRSGYQRSKARTTFAALRDATDLRRFAFDHSTICQDDVPRYHYIPEVSIGEFLSDSHPMFLSLKKAHERSRGTVSLLDMVKIEWESCHVCAQSAPGFPEKDSDCQNRSNIRCAVICKDSAEHCQQVEAKVRAALAKYLGIKDDIATEIP